MAVTVRGICVQPGRQWKCQKGRISFHRVYSKRVLAATMVYREKRHYRSNVIRTSSRQKRWAVVRWILCGGEVEDWWTRRRGEGREFEVERIQSVPDLVVARA